jgi:hypothetical protein
MKLYHFDTISTIRNYLDDLVGICNETSCSQLAFNLNFVNSHTWEIHCYYNQRVGRGIHLFLQSMELIVCAIVVLSSMGWECIRNMDVAYAPAYRTQ